MKFRLQKPWKKMVDIPLEKELYYAIKKSMLEDMLREVNEQIRELNED